MSSICKKSDIHPWHNEKIFDLIKETPRYHRKYWEIGFIISNLLKLNLLSENKETTELFDNLHISQFEKLESKKKYNILKSIIINDENENKII